MLVTLDTSHLLNCIRPTQHHGTLSSQVKKASYMSQMTYLISYANTNPALPTLIHRIHMLANHHTNSLEYVDSTFATFHLDRSP